MRAASGGTMLLIAAGLVLNAQPRTLAKWPPHATVGVWLDTRSAPPGSGRLVERAVGTWNRAADGRFVLKTEPSRDTAGIRVRFAQADGVYGETAPRIDRATGFIGSAEVLIAGEIRGDAIQQRIVIYLTALHELGHA